LFQDGAAPGIGLAFSDLEAGKQIFSGWHGLVGDEDAQNIIRVSLVQGRHPSRGDGYTVLVTANADAVNVGSATFPVPQLFKASDGHNMMMNRFQSEFGRIGAYWMMPIPLVLTGSIEKLYPLALIKRSLYFKDFSALTASEQEYAALG